MPIPKPNNNETEKEFIQRCMSDSKMTEEYDIDQRFAVCQDAFKTKLAGEKISFDCCAIRRNCYNCYLD